MAFQVKFSDDNINWVSARSYQSDAINKAHFFFESNPGTSEPYVYNMNGYYMKLYKSQVPNNFMMIRENNSVAYLKKEVEKYTKMTAQPGGISTMYLDTTIYIPEGTTYYYDNINNKIAVGWHGSYNPPYDMDGISVV
jgi:hypothetical protein